MDKIGMLERTYAHTAHLLEGLPAGALRASTPCSGWDVHQLIDHMLGIIETFTALASGQEPTPSAGLVGPDAAAAFATATSANLAAWREPEAMDRFLDVGLGPMAGSRAVLVNATDTLVHAWDLAKATGQDPLLPNDIADACYEAVRVLPLDAARAAGAFAPEVQVSPMADPTERLVALLGRTPG